MMNTQAPMDEGLIAMYALDVELESGTPLPEAIRATVARYPDQTVAVADYAAHIAVLGSREAVPIAIADEADAKLAALVDKAAERNRQSRNGAAITSLLALAEKRFGTASRLAPALSIGHSVLVKLDRRLIQFASIPSTFLAELAHQLRVSQQSLEQYLRQPPRLALAAEYKSRRRPSTEAQQSFESAIAASVECNEISAESTARWNSDPER